MASGIFRSQSKTHKINELRDSLTAAKTRIKKDSVTLHKINAKYYRLLKSEQALKDELAQDSLQRNYNPFYPGQNQQDTPGTKPRKRHKFLGLF
jgi:hypothetical protein